MVQSQLGFLAIQNNSIIFSLKPFHGILLHKTMRKSNSSCFTAPVTNIHTSTTKYNIEVHSIDTNRWIVLDAQVDVLLDSESKVSISREVVTAQLIFPHLKSTFKNLFCFGPSYCTMYGNLFVTTDTK